MGAAVVQQRFDNPREILGERLREGSIYRLLADHGDVLFGYYEYTGSDHDADQARIAADPTTRRWWTLTDPCQERLPGTPDGHQWAPMTEVWHLQ